MVNKKFTKYFNYESLLILLVSSSIFITTGNNILDYSKFIFLKIILIFLIHFKVNYLNEISILSKKNKVIIILLSSFILSVTISFLSSPYKIDVFGYDWLRIRYLNTITNFFLYISFFLYLNSIKIDLIKLIKFFIFPGIIYSIYLLIKIITSKEILNNADTFLFFDGLRMTGMLFTFYISIYLGYLAYYEKDKNTFKHILILTLFSIIIFSLKGKASIISILTAYFTVFLIFIKNNEKIKLKSAIFLFSIIFAIFISEGILSIINEEGKTIISYGRGSNNEIFYVKDRIELWIYAFKKFLDYPFFGLGPGSFFMSSYNELMGKNQIFYYNGLGHTHPHNFLLQFLIEWGLVGTLILISLLYILFIKSIKNIVSKKNYLLLIPGLNIVSMTIYGLFDGAYFHPTFTFLIVLSFSIISSELTKKNKYNF